MTPETCHLTPTFRSAAVNTWAREVAREAWDADIKPNVCATRGQDYTDRSYLLEVGKSFDSRGSRGVGFSCGELKRAADHVYGPDLESRLENLSVTLCIAAACEMKNGEQRIVLCTDWKAEETLGGASLGSSENADKLYWLKKGWAALIAGSETHGQELVRAYAKHMAKNKPSKWGDVQEELKKPAQAQRETLIDAHLKKTTGVSLEWFLEKGKEKLPAETVRDCISEIKRVSLNASMIVAGFVTVQFNPASLERRQHPLIFVVQSDEEALAPVEILRLLGKGS